MTRKGTAGVCLRGGERNPSLWKGNALKSTAVEKWFEGKLKAEGEILLRPASPTALVLNLRYSYRLK